jgi:hypothetical protein
VTFLMYRIPYVSKKTHSKIPLVASPLTTGRVRASVYEGTSLLTVHTVDPHTVDRSCTPYSGRGGRGRGGGEEREGGKRGKYFAFKIVLQYNCSTFYIFYSRGNLESGSFTYMRNSVCKYIRNSPEFRGIPGIFTAKFRRKSKTHFRGHPKCDATYSVIFKSLS